MLRVVLVKPSKYGADGYVERFRWGFMPNSTLPYMSSLTPGNLCGTTIETHCIDEYIHPDLSYLNLLERRDRVNTLVAFVGVQSHQFHRALDLAAYARRYGCHTIIGGPHVMTCDTKALHNSGVSFALAEAERIWNQILQDAIDGELQSVYGGDGRWADRLDPPIINAPSRSELRRHVVPILGLYPARGCPFSCTFCSVVKIAGRRIRSIPISTTIDSLKSAVAAGIRFVMITSDNFNKYPEAPDLLNTMISEKINVRFMVQCDTQISRQDDFIALMARAGCTHLFVGAESFNKEALKDVNKLQNRPDTYRNIVDLCKTYGIDSHFSNIVGFPTDSRASIDEHMDLLSELDPTWASFYILCPIPGTEQYDTFRKSGLIHETNLDRFDTTCLTWNHPNFTALELKQMLFHCYSRFYSVRHTLNAIRNIKVGGYSRLWEAGALAFSSLYQRCCAARKIHPMSGGIVKVRIDSDLDYRTLRQRAYGFDYAPLPDSLLSPLKVEPALG